MPPTPARDSDVHDALIIGAGLSGICSLHHIRERFPSWRVKVLEAAEGPGGTWLWNCYPGARFDSDSISYGFSFDKDILDEWHWKEAFSPQPETLRYIEYVCQKHNLRRDMHFNTRITRAEWREDSRTWLLEDESRHQYQTRFLVSCLGFLSSPTLPAITDIESFQGQLFHTSRWPKDCRPERDFAGKRIGVIGTGATGIQTITELSKVPGIKSLHVFQRTANWSAPLRNSEITVEQMRQYRGSWDSIFRQCAQTPTCFLYKADPRRSCDVTPAERLELWEKLYAEPGFGKWLGTFSDTYTDREANRLYSNFLADKIRQRVDDPAVADSLIPRNHGFGTRRPPLESGYFEVYNQDNVRLVDLQKTPIRHFTATGIETADGAAYPLDVVVCATGFDAITGAFRAIDFAGRGKRPLLGEPGSERNAQAIWADQRARTYLGLTVPGMPNFFMVLGPHQPFGNATRNIEHAVDVVCNMMQYCSEHKFSRVEPSSAAADAWTEHVVDSSRGALSNEIDSWMTGVNRNVAGKSVRTVARYAGSAIEFRRRCEECRQQGWPGLEFA